MSLQYFDTVGWVLRPVGLKNRRPYNLCCVGGDVKPCSINQSTSSLFMLWHKWDTVICKGAWWSASQHWGCLCPVYTVLRVGARWCSRPLPLRGMGCYPRKLLKICFQNPAFRPQRRLCRQVSFLSVEQCNRCLTRSGDESAPDHCCTPAQNRWGSLGCDMCGLWTSPVPAWTGFCTRRAASAAPSGLGVRGHAATIPEVDVRWPSGPVAKEL